MGRIPNGAEVTVFATLPDWYLIQYGGLVGYVAARYIQVAS
jgi:uncharacterized protein YraI